VKVFPVPEPAGVTPTYFLALQLDDAAAAPSAATSTGSPRSRRLAWDKSEWYYTRSRNTPDLDGPAAASPGEVKATARFESGRAR